MKKLSVLFLFVLAIFGCNPGDDNQPEPEYHFNDSLIAYYPLDGNGKDYSGNNRNFTNYNALATNNHFGQISKAIFFNGSNTILTSGPGIEGHFNPAGSFTVSIWARIDDLSMDQNIVSKMESGGYELVFKSETKKISFNCYINGTFYELTANKQIQTGKWYQLCGVFSKGQTSSACIFYINGAGQNSIKLDGDQTITQSNVPVILGGQFDPYGYYYATFKGAMDELRFYNKAFSSPEIEGLYNAENIKMVYATVCEGDQYDFGGDLLYETGTYFHTFTGSQGQDSMVTLFLTVSPVYNIETNASIVAGAEYLFGDTVLTTDGTYHKIFQSASGCDSSVTLHLVVTQFDFNDGLIAYYPLNGDGLDASGNQKHLDNYGAVSDENHLGINSSAMSFNGTSSYLITNLSDEDYFDPANEISVCAWIKPANNVNYQAIICKEQSAGYGINFNQDFRKFYFTCNINGSYNVAFSQDVPNVNEWYFLVGTFSFESANSRIELYCNGVFQNMVEIGGYVYIENSNAPLVLGGNPDNYGGVSSFFNGSMDEVRLYNRALGNTEIQSLYNMEISKHK